MTQNNESRGRRRRGRSVLILLAIVLLYAYAVQVTKIDLQEPLQPRRQENLNDLIRDLARPDLFAYDTETRSTNVSIHMPCPEERKASQVTFEGRLILLTPNCATTTQDRLTLSGESFRENVRGAIYWHAAGATSPRRLVDFRADPSGTFSAAFTMPDIRETDEAQRIEVVEVLDRRIAGPSETSVLALEKIVETVLMALMASTIGTIIAIPISFIAARNLMKDVKLPLSAVMAGVILVPIFGGVGWLATDAVFGWVAETGDLPLSLGVFLFSSVVTWGSVKTIAGRGQGATIQKRVTFSVGALLATVSLFFCLAALSRLGLEAGSWLEPRLGVFGFLGGFVSVLSELGSLLLPIATGFVGILVAISIGGRYGQELVMRMPEAPARLLTAVLTVVGTGVLILALEFGFLWINLLGLRAVMPESTSKLLPLLVRPAIAIGLLAGLLSLTRHPTRQYPIGMATYTVTRGTLNGLRSIEPIMMGFVFVAWVGLGPFAGILALMLHSIADLGKLFSEEVENIDEGPREAITATGANGLQGVAFAVVPQITPHYIAYIFYRWDINVRMSTIIGFVGGGGIGFVLQRFLNQLLYTRASVLVIAIAIVVTLLDYVSSRVRSRII